MIKREIHIGDKFGQYKVISEPFIEGKYRKVTCECQCGKIRKVHCCSVNKLDRCWECRGKTLRKYKPGDYIGELEIVEVYKGRKIKVKCSCGKEKVISSSYDKDLKTCGCSKTRTGENHHSFKGCGQITGTIFAQIKNNAQVRDLEFNLDIEYISILFEEQKGKCALTKLDIVIGNTKVETTASLDRKDNKKGYVKGNVWWLHKDVNRIKSDLELEYFKQLCGLITENNVC